MISCLLGLLLPPDSQDGVNAILATLSSILSNTFFFADSSRFFAEARQRTDGPTDLSMVSQDEVPDYTNY